MIYLTLLLLAILVNRSDKSAMALSLVIGASAFAYIPLSSITDRNVWFITVFFADMFIIYVACWAWCKSSIPIIGLSFMLCVGHLIDWKFGTDLVYEQIANYLEYLEIISCIIFSPVVLGYIRKRIRHAIRNN
jgi:hypothetical protein